MIEEGAQKLLVEIRQLAADKKWSNLLPKVQFLRESFSRAKTLELATAELLSFENYLAFNESTKNLLVGSVIRKFQAGENSFKCAAFSPDNNMVAAALSDGTVRVFSLITGREIKTLKHTKPLAVRFSPDGTQLLVGESNGEVKRWDLPSGRELIQFKTRECNRIVFSRDCKLALLAHPTCSLSLWDTANGKKLKELQAGRESDVVTGISIADDNKFGFIAIYNVPQPISIWDLTTGTQSTAKPRADAGRAVFTGDGKHLLTTDSNGRLKLHDMESGRELRSISPSCENFGVSPDGRYVIGQFSNGFLKVWDLNSGEQVAIWQDGQVNFLEFSFDGRFVLGSTRARELKIWKVRN